MPRRGNAADPPHLLHLFATFKTGGPQMRTATIVNRLGGEFRHTIVPMDGDFGARSKVEGGAPCRFLEPPPRQSSLRYPMTMRKFVRALGPDLVLTYNWGSMDGFAGAATIPGMPIVHTEDGFGAEEATRLLARRVWTRRVLLRRAHRVVTCSRNLLRIAREQYRLPERLVEFIANGVDTGQFTPGRDEAMRRRLGIAADAVVFGFVGRLGAEKNLGLLLRAFAAADVRGARLVIVGEGPCEAELRGLAGELGIGAAVVFAGATREPLAYYRAMDVFAMSSSTEQGPVSLLEAMACGLPAVCTDVGDIAEMIGPAGRATVTPAGDVGAYTAALRGLGVDAGLRERLGEENRARCEAVYSVETMVQNYGAVYRSALGMKKV